MEGAGPELTFPGEYHLTAHFCRDMRRDLKISYSSGGKSTLRIFDICFVELLRERPRTTFKDYMIKN